MNKREAPMRGGGLARQSSFTFLALLLLIACSRHDDAPENGGVRQDTLDPSSSSVSTADVANLTYEQRQGQHLFLKYCQVCHGANGRGDGFNAFNLSPKPRDFTDHRYMNALSDARLLETVSQGGKGVNKSVLMPSWGGRLRKNEQGYIIAYLRYLAPSSH